MMFHLKINLKQNW